MERTIEWLTCKHCSENINSLDMVPKHKCFIGEEVFMDGNQMLFKVVSADDTEWYNDIANNNEMSATGQNNIKKSNAVWNKHSILAVLSLYEANLHMLDNPKKKTKIWASIADGLKDFGIEMSTDQIRWKINALTKKYKECIDNNRKSGRSPMSFEYFDQMQEILGKDEEANIFHTRSSNLPTKYIINTSPKVQCSNSSKETELEAVSSHSSTCSSSLSTNNSCTHINSTKKKNLIEKKARPLHGSGSNNAKIKNELGKHWLEYLQGEEKRREERDAKLSKLLEKKTEAINLQKRQLQMHEKELDDRKIITAKKLKCKEQRHEEIIAIERKKCKLLRKFLYDKENVAQFSDSDNN
ncbi:uncharacterized protein [Linepithema humile]|uniref:uncharacterized protein n=1 Tax=Linepithema humile TaxID=83485 RepID=UPI00351F1CF4